MVRKELTTTMLVCVSLLALALPSFAADPPAFEFSHEGPAGDWLVLNVPLVDEVDEYEWQQEYQVTATAPGDADGHLLVVPLDILSDSGSFPAAAFDPPVHLTIPAGETVTFGDAGHRGAGGGLWRSLAIAVASDVPFTFDLKIDPYQGYPGLGAPQLNAGTGTVVRAAVELFGTAVAPADQVHLMGTFASAGWHHIHIEYDSIQPEGARTYDVRLPTAAWEGVGWIQGYNMGVQGWAHSSGMRDMMGALVDSAGDFSVDLTYAHATWDVDVFVYEMPGVFILPEGWSSSYDRRQWPFWDCFTCPPLPEP